jgi:cytochrome P450
MRQAFPEISLKENLQFNLGYVVPQGLQGSFTRSPFWVSALAAIHPDPAAARFVDGLLATYGSEYLYVRMLTTKTLLVLDPSGVQQILERSPAVYADGRPKREGMQVFQPDAVTISRGDLWRERRRFNEAVLASGCPVHSQADAILSAIRDEVEATGGTRRSRWTWADLDQLFARITRRVIFGRAARDDAALTDQLRALMQEANRPIGRPKPPARAKQFAPFYRRIGEYLERAEPDSLMARCRETPSTERTGVAGQVPHWMFAMWETLSANTARTLAAILAHPEAKARVRQELASADPSAPSGVASLTYLAGCLQEAMRLWPTTPMLIREAVVEDELPGGTVPRGTQVLIWNSFNHRDHRRDPLANAFRPARWAHGSPSVLFNHLSSGTQVCAGADLVLFIGRAVIAALLAGDRYVLLSPDLHPGETLPYAFDQYAFEMTAR